MLNLKIMNLSHMDACDTRATDIDKDSPHDRRTKYLVRVLSP